VLYAACFTFVAQKVYAMLRDHHKSRGYLAFFLYYTLVWSFLRTVYWAGFAADASFITQTSPGSYLLFFFPLFFQYLTFSLLVTFLIKFVAGPGAWHSGGVRYRVRTVTWALGALFLAVTVASALLAAYVDESYYNIWLLANSVMFLLLSLGFSGAGFFVRSVPDEEFGRMLLKRRSLRGVIAAITAVFASRSIYDFLSFRGVATIDINRDDVSTDIACAVMYGVWEFFPLVLLLSTLAQAPARGGAGGAEGGLRMPTFGVFGAIAALELGGGDGEEALLGAEGGGDGGGGGGGEGVRLGGGGSSGALKGGGDGSAVRASEGSGGGGVGEAGGALRRAFPSSGALSDGSGSLGGSRQRMSHLNLTPLASPQLAAVGTPLYAAMASPQLGGQRAPGLFGGGGYAAHFEVGPPQLPAGGLGMAGGVLFSGASLAAFSRGSGVPYGSPSWMVPNRPLAEEEENY
jgi:hypothetical protein